MLLELTHRRLNPLKNEWILVSPQRTKRPWQGKTEDAPGKNKPEYIDDCYLCPGNKRANNEINPDYKDTFVFDNDFGALKKDTKVVEIKDRELFSARSERGICRVVCFSPKHNLTLAEMSVSQIVKVVKTWREEYHSLGKCSFINHVQIFENKGEIMGASNPHPHCQIWAQENIPNEVLNEQENQFKYYKEKGRTLLSDYIKIEKEKNERVVFENKGFILLVPFWAVWPFETMIISKRTMNNLLQFTEKEIEQFADIIRILAVKYDNVFKISFPYSAGIHQAPTDGKNHDEWHFHMHFYPPLLRSASVRKFMVGYEMLGEPQRDITPEKSAEILKQQEIIHYSSGS